MVKGGIEEGIHEEYDNIKKQYDTLGESIKADDTQQMLEDVGMLQFKVDSLRDLIVRWDNLKAIYDIQDKIKAEKQDIDTEKQDI